MTKESSIGILARGPETAARTRPGAGPSVSPHQAGPGGGERAGHALTLRLLQSLFAEEGAWEWTELTAGRDAAGAQTQPSRAVAARA